MDTKKLDKLADLLLDTGKSNNLINFKDTRTSTVEVLLPAPDVLFKKIDGSTVFEVFDPNIGVEEDTEEANDEEQMQGKTQKVHIGKDAYLSLYSDRIRKQNQLLIYNSSTNPLTVIKHINKKAKSFIEETGVNVAYMAFGFIHWKESESSHTVFRAPILLVPIHMEQASAVDPYYIRSAEDDIIVNPTFSYKMDAEYHVKLPNYDDEGLTAYLEKVCTIVSKLRWTVTAECKIGTFSFLKINMYRDLKDNAEIILTNRNIRLLLGEPVEPSELDIGGDSAAQIKDPLIELHSVVDADSSQIEAIEMAKAGKSFVLQGPPGTGKSQTITNIIAECLSDGKRVLFVSEKLAALNVVYNKLKQAGLSEFCLELHSHKANKKDVIAEICHTLRTPRSTVSPKANSEVAIKQRAERQLDAYAIALHEQRPVIEKSLYQIYESFAALRLMPDVDWVVPQLATKGEAYLTETSMLLEQYVDYIPSIGYNYKKSPWYGYIFQDTSYQAKSEVKRNLGNVVLLLKSLVPLLHEISKKFGIVCTNINDALNWQKFFCLASTTEIITPALLCQERFNAVNSALTELKSQSFDILSIRSALDDVFDENIYRIDGATYYKTLSSQYTSAISRLFHLEYKQLVRALCLCKKDGEKLSYSEAVAFTEQLANYQHKNKKYHEIEAPIKEFLGTAYNGVETDWAYVMEQMDALQRIFASKISFGALASDSNLAFERDVFADYAQRLESVFELCSDGELDQTASYFDTAIFNVKTIDCSSLLAHLNECQSDINDLDHWCHFRALLSKLKDRQVITFLDTVIDQNIEASHIVGTFKKLFYYQWIDSILSETPVLSEFNRITQDKAIQTFVDKDREQFAINKAKVRAELFAKLPFLDVIAPGSALSVLLQEETKKRKQKSIRSLFSETGELVQRIKPCFLMSPLSVSTFLAADSIRFDVVIFDEASQIFPQDAIGAIYRAKQLIVVGDSKQMPPSNFFINASIETEDNDTESSDITDFESILDLCSTTMQQIRLRWHYRSRYEQLISFSNRNFYDNDLVTFPSSKADTLGIGVDYYHVDGIFDRTSHTNRKEAEFIVDLIYQNIEKYPQRSLGVVAFSVAQQDLIDRLLAKRRQNTPEQEYFFRSDAKEPFFVKNLETVQGDERDTIIFSTAYGRDTQGRLLHNFGPLNRVGGERRLNVAVTRAKCNVQVVSSMHYTDIDLNRTSSAGAKLLREYLDFAENGNIALDRTVSLSAYEQYDSDFELEVCDFLRSKGFSVDTQVGCSGYRIDLGLKLPNSSDYVLAIECDGATYHSLKNARDRDRLRQEILERMGWKFYRIWSTDWFRNKSAEQARLLAAASDAIKIAQNAVANSTPSVCQAIESFEEVIEEKPFEFPVYRAANIDELRQKYLPYNFLGMIKAILEVEAPLSEELLLKRIVGCFGREKVTDVVRRTFEHHLSGYQRYGITRKNGFLYLADQKNYQLRAPGDIARTIKQIAPEELAAGMLEILKQNVTADKIGLYRSIAQQCGFNRVGKSISEYLDVALQILDSSVTIKGDCISLK